MVKPTLAATSSSKAIQGGLGLIGAPWHSRMGGAGWSARSDISRAVQTLRRFALRHRDAVEDFPWGDRTIKVRGKIFLFLGQDGETLNLSVKLPRSAEAGLAIPFSSPTRC